MQTGKEPEIRPLPGTISGSSAVCGLNAKNGPFEENTIFRFCRKV